MADFALYDKSKWHEHTCREAGLAESQAAVHIGMFIGWLVDKGFLNGEMVEAFGHVIQRFEQGTASSADLCRIMGGALASDMLSPAIERFVADYYGSGSYVSDYDRLFRDYPSAYHVADTKLNYERVSSMLNKQFAEWEAPRP